MRQHWRALSDNEVGQISELCRIGTQPVGIPRGPPIFKFDVLPFLPTQLGESLPECAHLGVRFRLGDNHKNADFSNAVRKLLRPHHQRPHNQAAKKGDEPAPPHCCACHVLAKTDVLEGVVWKHSDVRFGSKAEIARCQADVRFTPESGRG